MKNSRQVLPAPGGARKTETQQNQPYPVILPQAEAESKEINHGKCKICNSPVGTRHRH